MRTKIVLILMLIIYYAEACSIESKWLSCKTDPKTNNAIVMYQGYNQILLKSNYGMIKIWDNKEKKFYLFDNIKKMYFVTPNFNIFLSELGKLPNDITLELFDVCMAGLAYAMPASATNQLDDVLKKGNKKEILNDDNIIDISSQKIYFIDENISEDKSNKTLQTINDNIVILTNFNSVTLHFDDLWIPSNEIINKTLNMIKSYLKNANSNNVLTSIQKSEIVKILENFSQYKIQIIAIVAAELKFIYFNFLPAEIDIEWKTHQIDHYQNGWHITYDLKDNIVSGFYTTNDEK